MFKKAKELFQIKSKIFLFGLALWGQHVMAKMPSIDDPSQGKKGGLLPNMQAYMYDGFAVGGLIIVGGAFIVAANILIEYNNIGEGKGSWAKFGTLVVIGVVLVVACIWFATLAAETLLN